MTSSRRREQATTEIRMRRMVANRKQFEFEFEFAGLEAAAARPPWPPLPLCCGRNRQTAAVSAATASVVAATVLGRRRWMVHCESRRCRRLSTTTHTQFEKPLLCSGGGGGGRHKPSRG